MYTLLAVAPSSPGGTNLELLQYYCRIRGHVCHRIWTLVQPRTIHSCTYQSAVSRITVSVDPLRNSARATWVKAGCLEVASSLEYHLVSHPRLRNSIFFAFPTPFLTPNAQHLIWKLMSNSIESNFMTQQSSPYPISSVPNRRTIHAS